MSQTPLTLSDEAIGQVAKLLQLAMLSGTYIIDHMRMLQFCEDGHTNLVLTDDYKTMFEQQLATMEARLEEALQASLPETPEA